MARSKLEARKRRKVRIRKKVTGTGERPRLVVFRSSRHIYAQVVDDASNRVVATSSTLGKADRGQVEGKNKMDQAKAVGSKIAEVCKGNGVHRVVFDRNGYKYHGRVLALAGAARKGGLEF